MKIQITRISKKLKNLREQKKLTQEELAKHLGISRQSIIALEQGRCLPSLPLALSFSEIFETPFENIFGEFENLHHNFREEVKNFMSNDLSPWSPMREASQLHAAIDRLFEENWPNVNVRTSQVPQVNIVEKGKTLIISADLPGVKEEDLSIEVGDEMVTLAGERKTEEKIEDEDFYRQEVSYGSFSRTIPLPSVVDKNKAVAELRNGTLTITIPKKAKIVPKVTKVKVKKV